MRNLTRSDLTELNVFLSLTRSRSFRVSSLELDVSSSAISHSLRNLQNRLGVKLMNRTSRSVVPTVLGETLAKQLEVGFESIGTALDALEQHRNFPVGRLRLNIPYDASVLLLHPVLAGFVTAYPSIDLDIAVDDRIVDIVADGFDAGIRYGNSVPRDMVAVPLTQPLRWVVVGSPAYLARRGRPLRPADLRSHACVRMRLGDKTLYKWELEKGNEFERIDVPGPICVNNTQSVLNAVTNGIGLGYCLERHARDFVRTGQLEIVLADWAALGEPLMMYYTSRRQPAPGLKQLIETIQTAEGVN